MRFGWHKRQQKRCMQGAQGSAGEAHDAACASGCSPHCTSGNDSSALNCLKSGSRAEVVGICAGCRARTRLASLGLIPGSLLHVVANPGVGPLLLSVGESRLMVERGIATKVLVEQV